MCPVPRVRAKPLPLAACCRPISAKPLAEGVAERLAGAFQALAEPARLRLLALIQAEPGGEACVCHLVGPLGLSQPTVTHHLQVLHRAGLLEREKRGIWVYYRVSGEALEALRSVLR
jgi:ArsR family transcriptional regulator